MFLCSTYILLLSAWCGPHSVCNYTETEGGSLGVFFTNALFPVLKDVFIRVGDFLIKLMFTQNKSAPPY